MNTTKTTVAVLGLGLMGRGMAASLLRAGYDVRVYNRTLEKARQLEQQGAKVCETPSGAAAQAHVVISMVGDDEASRTVWIGERGALNAAPAGAVLVECSTLSLNYTRTLARQALERELPLLDAPVIGSRDAARDGQLKLFVGGDLQVLQSIRPVLEAFAARVTHLGPTGSGTLMKLIHNQILAAQAAALAEGLALAELGGLDAHTVADLLADSSVGSPMVRAKAPMMVARTYDDVHFTLRWLHKDVTYALQAAEELAAEHQAGTMAHTALQHACVQGLGDQDFSALIETFRPIREHENATTSS